MGIQSLEMTSIWDDNYMILDSTFEKPGINRDLETAIQQYVASTIKNSNVSGDNFLDSNFANSTEKEEFEDSQNNSTYVPINSNNNSNEQVNSISEYVSNNCKKYLKEGETIENKKVDINPETIGSDPYSLCVLGNNLNEKNENLSDYQINKKKEHYEILRKKSRNINKLINTSMKTFNLRETSIYELYDNSMVTLYNIINDLTNFKPNGDDFNKNLENIIKIFIGNNRLMYVGIIIVIISFIIYLLDTSS